MNSNKEKLLHRVKIIKGHVAAIEKMLAEDRYCIDIVHQSIAVQQALKKFDSQLLTDHIKHCVVKQAQEGDSNRISDELVQIFEYK